MPNEIEPAGSIIDSASVKVMRSHDYCHFEVVLGTSSPVSPEQVNELRKTAARLADKAVEQYKIAKVNFEKLNQKREERKWEGQRVSQLKAIPEEGRTEEDKARIKAYDDETFEMYRKFNYEDDWHEDEQQDDD